MAQLDASIIGGIKPIEVPDQTNLLLKGLQAQGLMGQNQLQQLQIGQQQQSYARQNALMQYLASPDGQSDDLNTRINKSVMLDPINGPKIAESYLNTQKTQADIASTKATTGKTQYDLQHQQIVATGGELGAAAQQGPAAVLNVINTSQNIPDQLRPLLLQQAQADPVGFATRQAQATLTAQQQRELTKTQFLPTEAGIAAVTPTLDGTPATGYMVGNTQGAASARNGQPGVGPGVPAASAVSGPPTQNVDWEGTLRAALGDPNPAMRQEAQARLTAMGTPLGNAGPQAGVQPQGAPSPQQVSQALPLGAKPSGTWEVDPNTGQRVYAPKFATPGDVLSPAGGGGLSDQDKALAKSIANLDLAPMNGMALRNPRNAAIMAEVFNQNPQYDATDYQAKQTALRNFSPSGQAGKTLRSLAVASDHLDTLADAGAALQNGQYPLVNKIANAFNVQTGGTAVGSFNAVKQIVGDEVVKAVLGGAGGVGDREAIQKTIDAAKTPQDLNNVISHYRTLMAAQKEALVSDYANQTGRADAATRFNYKSAGASSPAVPAGWNVQVVNQ